MGIVERFDYDRNSDYLNWRVHCLLFLINPLLQKVWDNLNKIVEQIPAPVKMTMRG